MRGDLKRLSKTDSGILIKEVENIQVFGAVIVQNNNVEKIVEKPLEPLSHLANTGAYCFTTEIFSEALIPSQREEYEITDYINQNAGKIKFKAVKVQEAWIPIGYPWSLLHANKYLLDQIKGQKIRGKVERGATLKGAVRIGRGTLVKAGAYIEGPAVIGENCEIGPHAYIRPHTSIGDNCKIGGEVFDTILFDHVAAKHCCYLGHSVVGEKCNIGAGTITADFRHDEKNHITLYKGKKIDTGRRKLGAFLGDNVKTAIHTSFYPGRMIWPDSHTLPGEVITKNVES